MLWGPSASLVTVRAPNRQYGELEEQSVGTAISKFSVEPVITGPEIQSNSCRWTKG